MKGTEKRHIAELDGIRAIAIITVVFSHLSFVYYSTHAAAGALNHLLFFWLQITRLGWMGVDIFFALSGFLITGVLYEALGKAHYYRNFYIRRVLRIFPVYYLTLLVTMFWYHFPWKFLGISALMCANMAVYFNIPLVLPPLWSLAVEEHFYLVWPWVVRYLRPRSIKAACLVVIVAEPLLRLLAFRLGYFQEFSSWYRFDGMAVGGLIAIQMRTGTPAVLKRIGNFLVCGSLIAFLALLPFGITTRQRAVGVTLIYSLTSLFTGGVIALVLATPHATWSAPLRSRFLRFIGDTSFFVYLAHWFILASFWILYTRLTGITTEAAVHAHGPAFYAVEAVYTWAVSLGLGYLSMRYFENPIRRIGKRLR
jgi:peptidoglycan/LPS O-acetylase OafA/YrhL